MKNYWQNLNEREQKLLIAGSVILVIYLIYSMVYLPITRTIKTNFLELQEKKQTLGWMQNIETKYVIKKRKNISSSELLSILAQQITHTSFRKYQYQLQQNGSGEIQLSFNEVPFNACIKWLESFSKQYAIKVKQITGEKTQTPGLVKLSVVFAM